MTIKDVQVFKTDPKATPCPKWKEGKLVYKIGFRIEKQGFLLDSPDYEVTNRSEEIECLKIWINGLIEHFKTTQQYNALDMLIENTVKSDD